MTLYAPRTETIPVLEGAAPSAPGSGAVGFESRRSQTLQIDGTTLAYVEHGDPRREPIVLLHGYLGSHRSWRHQIPPLSATHRVVALDWFGWGDSGRDVSLRYDYDSEVDQYRINPRADLARGLPSIRRGLPEGGPYPYL